MPELHFSIVIKGSAETIFDVLADLAHYDRWLPGSEAFGGITEISPLPVRVGTTYVDAGPAGVRHGTVTEFEPPTRLSFYQPMEVARGPVRGTIDIHLRHVLLPDRLATRLDRDLTLGLRGLLKAAEPFVVASFRRENERMLRILKDYVEHGGVAADVGR
jgi:uncharacterized protein YndB with AHSA1/START domain